MFVAVIFAILLIVHQSAAWTQHCDYSNQISVSCQDSTSFATDKNGRENIILQCELRGEGGIAPTIMQPLAGSNKIASSQLLGSNKIEYVLRAGSENEQISFKVDAKSGCNFKLGVTYQYKNGHWHFVSKTVLPSKL